MGKVFALLVGINNYAPAVADARNLSGCVNDAKAAEQWLVERCGADLAPQHLYNHEATRDAMRNGIRRHLGRARKGDTAVLWFSGHGRQVVAVTEEDKKIEPSGRCQALVCWDGELLDKELGRLLDDVAGRGAQVTVVLDCCFAEGGTRGAGDATVRGLPPLRVPAGTLRMTRGSSEEAVRPRELGAAWTWPVHRHALLAASGIKELALENRVGGTVHGVFTRELLRVLRTDGADGRTPASCRALVAAARPRVLSASYRTQRPTVFPEKAGRESDRPFLGAMAARADLPRPYRLAWGLDGWEVDCGTAHGLRDDKEAYRTEFTVTGRRPAAGEAPVVLRARKVYDGRTLVDVVSGAAPAREDSHPVALSALAQPPIGVRLDVTAANDPAEADRLLRGALAAAGPHGGPSPLLQLGDGGHEGEGRVVTELRVRVRGSSAGIEANGTDPVPETLPLHGKADAETVAACLVHMARWYQLRALDNPHWPVGRQVRLEITRYGENEPLLPDGNNEIVLPYERENEGWRKPLVTIRLRSQSRRDLWCLLVDLTDSFKADTELFQGGLVGSGCTGHALNNEPVELRLPEGREERPGAEVRDWLLLVVAEQPLNNTLPFQFNCWSASRDGHRSTLAGGQPADALRLFEPAELGLAGLPGTSRGDVLSRDAGPKHDPGDTEQMSSGQWGVSMLRLRTVIPEE
jgi:hypothetical protein